MTADWRTFLLDQGAEFTDSDAWRVEHFGNPTRENQLILNGTALCDLNHYGIIQVSGEDALTFLQGQFSNDINLVDRSNTQLSAYCNPKGRVLALLRVIKTEEGFLLVLEKSLLPTILKRLQMFVMMSKVSLLPANDKLVIFGVSGPDAEDEVQKWLVKPPQIADQSIEKDDVITIRLAAENPRYLIITSPESAIKLWADFNVNAAPVGAEPWQLLDILAGIPEITSDTTESHVPQMLNLDKINVVSFSKGCYPGQEIVARMHYLGKLKKRMYRLEFPSGVSLKPGLELYSPQGRNDESVGSVITFAPHPEGTVTALAVLQKKIFEAQGQVHLPGDDTMATIHTPPYDIEN